MNGDILVNVITVTRYQVQMISSDIEKGHWVKDQGQTAMAAEIM